MRVSRSDPLFRVVSCLLLSSTAAAEDLAGTIHLEAAETRGFAVHEDRFGYAARDGLRHFPDIAFAVVQDGAHLIPANQGIRPAGNEYWEVALQPGRVWREDGSGLRAALPIALVERNANCTHNGVLSWRFGDNGVLTDVLWQIGSETCAYFKFDAWAVARGEFHAAPVVAADVLGEQYRSHLAARLPVIAIEEIGKRYPGVPPEAFGAVGGMKQVDMSVYGFVVDGVHYRSGCETRLGQTYPFCDEMLLPSYSTAKSIFAGLALMRLEQLFPGSAEEPIAALVPQCDAEGWQGITIEHALDMTTGHYDDIGFEVDEAAEDHVAFLYAATHAEKVRAACTLFPRREAPGNRFVYHTSDTYLAGTAMQALLKRRAGPEADIHETLLVDVLFRRLHLSAVAQQTRRTYDEARQPLTGWGLTFIADDVARIANWLNADGGRLDDEVLLDEGLFGAAMQRQENDRGAQAGTADFRYNNGFWAHDIAPYIACDEPVWVPFMSGYGGISVVLFPNGTSYYYFSDGYTQRWREAAVAANRIRGMCP